MVEEPLKPVFWLRLRDLLGLLVLAVVLLNLVVVQWVIAGILLTWSLPWIAIAAVFIWILPGRRFVHFAMVATAILLVISFLGPAVIDPGWVMTIEQAVTGLRQDGGLAIGSGHTFSNSLYAPNLGAHLGYADGHVELLMDNVPSGQWKEVFLVNDGKPRGKSSNLSDGLR